MVYKCFNKKSFSLAEKSIEGSGFRSALKQNEQLKNCTNQLLKYLKSVKCIHHFKIVFVVLILQICN